ncbi:hypothetical protein WMO40_12335 [Bacillaceae bacterium CLA-AA-H227]|uniref:Uncharacterized protein n=1 Tax=Robertmurraya yapensis (ex Hitch et al 2024) TaxID=3133160 RepID=A0ACC6SBM1_9BACI
MQIQMNNSLSLSSSTNSPQLSIGDVLNVSIKERPNQTDAIVSLKGTKATVKFEGAVPKENNLTVEITGVTEEGNYIVKVSDKNISPSNTQQSIPQGTDSRINEIIKSFAAKGMPLTKENVASIRIFLANDKYTAEQKMNTLDVMAQKTIFVSESTLASVAEALNGKSLTQSLLTIVENFESGTTQDLDAILEKIQTQPNDEQVIKAVENFLKRADFSKKSVIEKSLNDFKKQVGQNLDAKDQLVQNLTQMVKGDSKPLISSEKLQYSIEDEVTELEAEFSQEEPVDIESASKAPLSKAEQYVINEAVQALNIDSRNIMVTQVTKKLSQMAIGFRALKQDVTKNLDNISKIIEQPTSNPQSNVKQILESTIHKLDRAILKGEFLLYTDMETEKRLLTASSQLGEAKKFLAMGEIAEANKILLQVKGSLEKLVFNPSDVKVKHFVSDKLGMEISNEKQMGRIMEQVSQPLSGGESSSRQMYETLRKLGVTHESEVGQSLLSKSGPANIQQGENLKSTLLKMMNQDDLKPQQKQQVEQAIAGIAGQQLLNKQDTTGQQNLFFQLPYMLDKQAENIKIYVNSRKEGDKVDWENCSIYVVLETKKLGEIGVLLSSSERSVNLTFRSNKEQLQEKISGFEEITKERFKEIGYNLNGMNVKPIVEQFNAIPKVEKVESEPEPVSNYTEKGYDITI